MLNLIKGLLYFQMLSLKENFNNFLFYLKKVRSDASNPIVIDNKTLLFKKFNIRTTSQQLRHSCTIYLLRNQVRSLMIKSKIYTKLNFSKKLNEYSKAYPLCQTDR